MYSNSAIIDGIMETLALLQYVSTVHVVWHSSIDIYLEEWKMYVAVVKYNVSAQQRV